MDAFVLVIQIAKANFFELLRRDRFFLTLLATLVLIIAAVPPPNAHHSIVSLGEYRLLYNSAWIGSLVAMLTSIILSLPGFFLIHGSVTKDIRSGLFSVAETSKTDRTAYLSGKFLGNVATLLFIVVVTALLAIILQLNYGEESYIRLWSLLVPFLQYTVPVIVLVAGVSILFEMIPVFSGMLGNIIYMCAVASLLLFGLPNAMNNSGGEEIAADVFGIGSTMHHVVESVKTQYPSYHGEFRIGLSFNDWNKINTPVRYEGNGWLWSVTGMQLAWFGGLMVALVTSGLFWFRFERMGQRSRSAFAAATSAEFLPEYVSAAYEIPAQAQSNSSSGRASSLSKESVPVANEWVWVTFMKQSMHIMVSAIAGMIMRIVHFRFLRQREAKRARKTVATRREHFREEEINVIFPAIQKIIIPLTSTENLHGFSAMLKAESKNLLHETPWWLFIVASLAVVASLVAPFDMVRSVLLPFSWIVPLFIWSKLGMRVSKHFRNNMSLPEPKKDFLFMQTLWSIGALVAIASGAGAGMRFLFEGEWAAFAVWLISAAFIPSLAFVLSIWTTTNYAFEGTYVLLWLFGCASKKPMLDFMGTVGDSLVVQNPLLYLLWTLAIITFVAVGSQRLLERKVHLRMA